jgi:superfamily II DNA helicase RecQ
MALFDPVENQARRRRIEQDRQEQRLLRQRQQRCRALRAVIIEFENEIVLRRERIEVLSQEARDLMRHRLSITDPKERAETQAELEQMRSQIDRIKLALGSAERRLENARRDFSFHECGSI